MATFKTSRQITGGPISFRAFCRLEGRQLPASARDFMNSTGSEHFSGQLSTGDVDCTWEMAIAQNGVWSASAAFHDGGTFAGDFFFLELLLDPALGIGTRLEGNILDIFDGRHLTLSTQGLDSKIRDSWSKFRASGPTATLHAAPAVGELAVSPLAAFLSLPTAVQFGVIGGGIILGVIVAGGSAKQTDLTLKVCNQKPSDFNPRCATITPFSPSNSDGSAGPD